MPGSALNRLNWTQETGFMLDKQTGVPKMGQIMAVCLHAWLAPKRMGQPLPLCMIIWLGTVGGAGARCKVRGKMSTI